MRLAEPFGSARSFGSDVKRGKRIEGKKVAADAVLAPEVHGQEDVRPAKNGSDQPAVGLP